MSPRAAWRLEAMGLTEVYDYGAGKEDWMAAGLPTEGTDTVGPRAGDLARRDVPTCRLGERLGDVGARVRTAGWNACVIVNEERVVFGLLRREELDGDPDQSVETAMRPGPSTFRTYTSLADMAKFFADKNIESSPVTTSDGRLVGLLMRTDVARVTN